MTPKQRNILSWLYETGQIEMRCPLRAGIRCFALVLCRRYRDSIYSADVVRDVYEVARISGIVVDEV